MCTLLSQRQQSKSFLLRGSTGIHLELNLVKFYKEGARVAHMAWYLTGGGCWEDMADAQSMGRAQERP